MKKTALFFIVIVVFSLNCFAQKEKNLSSNTKMSNEQLVSNSIDKNDVAVVSYHVEERINLTYGSNITTYNVSNLSLVNTNDLGQNNTRIITPKYAKTKSLAVASEQTKTTNNEIVSTEKPIIVDNIVSDEKEKTVKINILSTYERIMQKGYKTQDMLRKVADSRFFEGKLVIAAKWYSELFALATDLETVYYYRYAQSLKSIGEIEKANEMIKIFKSKDSQK